MVQGLLTEDTLRTNSDAQIRATRVLSRSVFGGAAYRLEIGAAIADTGGIANASELADTLGISRQSVTAELQVLERAGLVGPPDRSGRKAYRLAHPSGYWALCRKWRDSAPEMLRRNPLF